MIKVFYTSVHFIYASLEDRQYNYINKNNYFSQFQKFSLYNLTQKI
jgi:hypothetical protein